MRLGWSLTLALTWSAVAPAMASAQFEFDSYRTYNNTNYYGDGTPVDLDNDGILDVVTTGPVTDEIDVRFGIGDGTFAAPVSYPSGPSARLITSGDLDDDGWPDIVVASNDPPSFRVFLNDGSGGLLQPQEFPVSINQARTVRTADFNEDGNLDIAISSASAAYPGITVVTGDGNGNLDEILSFATGGIYDFVIADINEDDHLDIVAVRAEEAEVVRLFGDGAGSFSIAAPIEAALPEPHIVVTDDLDADGHADLVILGESLARTLLGSGDGSFSFAGEVACEDQMRIAISGDVDDDGDVDLVVFHGDDDPRLCVFSGVGDGTFTPTSSILALGYQGRGLLTDLDFDGDLDLLTIPTAGVAVFENENGAFPSPPTVADVPGAVDMLSADFNGDDLMDILLAYHGGNVVIFGDGLGTFPESAEIGGHRPFAVTDVDSDGAPDIITSSFQNESILIHTNSGTGDFVLEVELSVGIAKAIVPSDFDADGFSDLAILRSPSSTSAVGELVVVFGGPGGPALPIPLSFYVTGQRGLAVEDLDGDGDVDILTADPFGNQISLFLGDGAGGFSAGGQLPVPGPGPWELFTADFNADTLPDILALGGEDSYVLLAVGIGVFGLPEPIGISVGLSRILTDLDEDGAPDLAVGFSNYFYDVALLRGLGDGTFSTPQRYGTAGRARALAAGDFDGDGRNDLIVGRNMPGPTTDNLLGFFNRTLPPDCNLNGVPDDEDIAGGVSTDCNDDGIPDECQLFYLDCNENGVVDACDIADGTSQDCNESGSPDECELNNDCNRNGIPDSCDITLGIESDCNGNGYPDSCDLASGALEDLDMDGIPDGCEPPFLRGDCNGSGGVGVSDATCLLAYLFLGGQATCLEALDANANCVIEVTDVIHVLRYLFQSGAPPPMPFPMCQIAPTNGICFGCDIPSCP